MFPVARWHHYHDGAERILATELLLNPEYVLTCLHSKSALEADLREIAAQGSEEISLNLRTETQDIPFLATPSADVHSTIQTVYKGAISTDFFTELSVSFGGDEVVKGTTFSDLKAEDGGLLSAHEHGRWGAEWVEFRGLANTLKKHIEREAAFNVILCGGGAKIQALPERLEADLHELVPRGTAIQVKVPNDPVFAAVTGGSLQSSLSTFDLMWIERSGGYAEHGSRIVYMMCG